MPTIPNLNWGKQTNTPTEEFENEKDQILGCIGCALEETPTPTPPPGTIFMFRGSSLCITHLVKEKRNLQHYGTDSARTLT